MLVLVLVVMELVMVIIKLWTLMSNGARNESSAAIGAKRRRKKLVLSCAGHERIARNVGGGADVGIITATEVFLEFTELLALVLCLLSFLPICERRGNAWLLLRCVVWSLTLIWMRSVAVHLRLLSRLVISRMSPIRRRVAKTTVLMSAKSKTWTPGTTTAAAISSPTGLTTFLHTAAAKIITFTTFTTVFTSLRKLTAAKSEIFAKLTSLTSTLAGVELFTLPTFHSTLKHRIFMEIVKMHVVSIFLNVWTTHKLWLMMEMLVT